MARMQRTLGAALLILSAGAGMLQAADKLLLLRFGALWPRVLLDNDRPTAWDVGLQYGLLADRKVGVGVGLDFLWNHTADEIKDPADPTGSRVFVNRQETSLMFPVSAFVFVDPISHLVVHPALSFALGYNSMVYTWDDKEGSAGAAAPPSDPDGYYFGLYMKLGLDAIVNLGETSRLFLGGDYQWAKTRSAKTEGNSLRRRNMSGFGVRGGLAFVL